MKKILFIAVLPLVFVGCSSKKSTPNIDFKEPKYVKAMPSKEEDVLSNSGSIFGQGFNPLFSDIKAMKVNDIVIISVNEKLNSKSNRTKNINKAGETALGGGLFQPGDNADGPITALATKLNGLTNVNFKSNSESSFSGKGQAEIKEDFTTTVGARITKVMANGNYYIEGSREFLIDGEKQLVKIAGVIRPYDITQDNMINSKYISDAKISYQTEGDFQRTTQRGWGSKALESLWPF